MFPPTACHAVDRGMSRTTPRDRHIVSVFVRRLRVASTKVVTFNAKAVAASRSRYIKPVWGKWIGRSSPLLFPSLPNSQLPAASLSTAHLRNIHFPIQPNTDRLEGADSSGNDIGDPTPRSHRQHGDQSRGRIRRAARVHAERADRGDRGDRRDRVRACAARAARSVKRAAEVARRVADVSCRRRFQIIPAAARHARSNDS